MTNETFIYMSQFIGHMGIKTGHRRIMELFFEYPTKDFHIRGIAKTLNIPKATVGNQIKELIKNRLIIKRKKDVFPSFKANDTHEFYRYYKKQDALEKIMTSNLINYLEESCNPKCIVLFGSFAKGEYDINSDIDLFIQAAESELDIKKYEKKLKHKINILFEAKLNKLSDELLNNIINGVNLSGFLRIK